MNQVLDRPSIPVSEVSGGSAIAELAWELRSASQIPGLAVCGSDTEVVVAVANRDRSAGLELIHTRNLPATNCSANKLVCVARIEIRQFPNEIDQKLDKITSQAHRSQF